MEAPLKVGVLSFAHGHVTAYADVMKDFDDVKLIAAYDDNAERAQPICERNGMQYSEDINNVLSNEEIQAVMIGGETNRHEELCIAAAKAGKHILLQKPMAFSLEACDNIIAAVEEAGIEFAVAFQMRHDPANIRMRELIQKKALGNLAIARRRHCIGVLLDNNFVNGPTNWHIDPVKNKGMFMDDAVHAADWFYWLFGKPVSVIAEIDNVITNVAPDDCGVAVYRFEDGMIGILLNSSVVNAAENTSEIYGEKGCIIQNYGDGPSNHVPRAKDSPALKVFRYGQPDWEDQSIPIPPDHGHRIRAVPRPWVNSLLYGAPKLASAREGRVSVEMVLAAYESAQEGKRVLL